METRPPNHAASLLFSILSPSENTYSAQKTLGQGKKIFSAISDVFCRGEQCGVDFPFSMVWSGVNFGDQICDVVGFGSNDQTAGPVQRRFDFSGDLRSWPQFLRSCSAWQYHAGSDIQNSIWLSFSSPSSWSTWCAGHLIVAHPSLGYYRLIPLSLSPSLDSYFLLFSSLCSFLVGGVE